MKIKELIYSMELPCPKCPYTLGQVHTLADPCPQCRASGYQMFERFQKERSENYPVTTVKD